MARRSTIAVSFAAALGMTLAWSGVVTAQGQPASVAGTGISDGTGTWPGATSSTPRTAGWLFTPGLVVSESWDDNVLLHGQGDATLGDSLTVLNPRTTLDYTGKHGMVGVNYDGAFLLYRQLGTLDSYDQHGTLQAERKLSAQVTWFARDNVALLPRTDTLEFEGVPFLRIGSKFNDLTTGVLAVLNKKTTVTAAFTTQWFAFDTTTAFDNQLHGGYSVGGDASIHRQVTGRLALIGDYNLQHAIISGQIPGPFASQDATGAFALPNGTGAFDVQNATAGLEYQLSERTFVYGAGGVSYLSVNSFGPARTGPALKGGVGHARRRVLLDVAFSRSFVPAYGFGGTMQNEEVIARARAPLSQRIYVQTSVAWRRDDPLIAGDPTLKSWFVDGAAGYLLQPWARLEVFFSGARQVINQPGGVLNRNQIGVQVVMARPMRVQ